VVSHDEAGFLFFNRSGCPDAAGRGSDQLSLNPAQSAKNGWRFVHADPARTLQPGARVD